MGLKRGIVAILIGTVALIAGCSDDSNGKPGGAGSGNGTSGTDVSKDDLYAAGCPIVDAALGAGTIVRKGAARGLDGIRRNVDLTPQHDQWLKDAKDLLQNRDPNDAPDSVRSRVRSACADHDHPLQNLD
jgi:hypothetical protein